MNFVFVYGTLKRGLHNHRLLDHEGAEYLSDATTTSPFFLFADGLPYLVKAGGAGRNVKGELYLVDCATLERLDQLEGHPRFYRREEIWIQPSEGAPVLAWVYFLADPTTRIPRDAEPLTEYAPLDTASAL